MSENFVAFLSDNPQSHAQSIKAVWGALAHTSSRMRQANGNLGFYYDVYFGIPSAYRKIVKCFTHPWNQSRSTIHVVRSTVVAAKGIDSMNSLAKLAIEALNVKTVKPLLKGLALTTQFLIGLCQLTINYFDIKEINRKIKALQINTFLSDSKLKIQLQKEKYKKTLLAIAQTILGIALSVFIAITLAKVIVLSHVISVSIFTCTSMAFLVFSYYDFLSKKKIEQIKAKLELEKIRVPIFQ